MVYKESHISDDQVNDSIRMIQKMAKEQGFNAVLIGGVALQVYGSPKTTKDIDFALDQMPEDTGYLQKVRPIGFGGGRYGAPNGAKIDLIVRNDGYQELYEEAIQNHILSPRKVPIVTAEYLFAMKFAAWREHDILAMKWMVRQEGLLNMKEVGSIIYRHFGQFGQERFYDLVDQAVIEQEIKSRRGRSLEEE